MDITNNLNLQKSEEDLSDTLQENLPKEQSPTPEETLEGLETFKTSLETALNSDSDEELLGVYSICPFCSTELKVIHDIPYCPKCTDLSSFGKRMYSRISMAALTIGDLERCLKDGSSPKAPPNVVWQTLMPKALHKINLTEELKLIQDRTSGLTSSQRLLVKLLGQIMTYYVKIKRRDEGTE